jgi:co-chaperonin GroES (HSP10)
MTVRPLHDRLIVQRIDEGEQHVGGIIIMKEDDVLAVIEGQTKKRLAAIKGNTQKKKK